jgi:hypothetical protein
MSKTDIPLLGRVNAPSKISNLDFPFHTQQQILRLDISMDYIVLVQIRKTSCYLSDVLYFSGDFPDQI